MSKFKWEWEWDWTEDKKIKSCAAVVLFMFALWLIDVKTPKELECVCESCAIECAEECEVCEVRIEDGVRFVSRKNQSLSSVYPIKEEETEVELFFPK